jgi:hypothetical protein
MLKVDENSPLEAGKPTGNQLSAVAGLSSSKSKRSIAAISAG